MTEDLETCSWCTAEVPDDTLVEAEDGARICQVCDDDRELAVRRNCRPLR